jgi:hypothetical protein
MILFAHHVEPQHYPVLAIILVVGVWSGWHAVSVVLKLMRGSSSES